MPINFNLKEFKNNIFIETGLDRGFGVRKALDAGFEKIISIELRQESIDLCTPAFENELNTARVKFVLGDSADKLSEVIKDINEPVTFWLDAHVGNDRIYPKFVRPEQWCPLHEELHAIRMHQINTHTIIIDDIDQIKGKQQGWTHEVDEKIVLEKIKEINPDYKIEYRKGKTDNSILVARLYGKE